MGLSSGIAGGALTAMAAYGGTMALAAAGTGTAISSLTGAAATNATLAWLGGGTLASGGLGIAGGTMVLGLLVAGPALAIFGTIFGSKASKNLDDAYSARYEARTYAEKIKTITQKLEMIDKVTNLGVTVLTIMNQRLKESISPISNMLNRLGNEIKFSDDIDKLLFVAVKFAQVVKTIIDTPIMSKDGDLLPEAETSFKEIQNNTELIGN
jgi:hypothetical protein